METIEQVLSQIHSTKTQLNDLETKLVGLREVERQSREQQRIAKAREVCEEVTRCGVKPLALAMGI
jgi:hypothetical protein